MTPVQIAGWRAALLLGSSGIAQVKRFETQWVLVSEPIDWKSPPPELRTSPKVGFAEVMVLYPSGEYGYLGCALFQSRKGSVSISRGDSHIVRIGTWFEHSGKVEVTSRTVYTDGFATGHPIPSPTNVQRYTKMGHSGLRRLRDNKRFAPLPRLQDLEFLATLISCDRAYWDGQKHRDGPQPCSPFVLEKQQPHF